MTVRFHWFKSLSAVAIVALSLAVAYSASQMDIYSEYGPGAGLFPLVLSLLLATLTVIWLFTPVGEDEIAEALTCGGMARVTTILLTVSLATWWMSYLGFFVTSCLAMFVIMVVTGRHKMHLAAGLAIFASLGCVVLFQRVLGLALPASDLPIISVMGL